MAKSRRGRPSTGEMAPTDRGNGPGADPAAEEQRGSEAEAIRARAYELYLERGGTPGSEMDDWLRAEREFRERSGGRSRRGEAGSEPPPS